MHDFEAELIEFIRSNYAPQEKVSESKDGKKTTFFRKSSKSLCYITDQSGKSVVTVVIGASLNDKVQEAKISKKAKDMFTNAKQFHDGKWLHFALSSKQDVEDIKALLQIKKPLKKIKKSENKK